MKYFGRYGTSKRFARILVASSWPVIIAGKRLSNVPLLRWIINPFFKRPHNELTVIPIQAAVEKPESALIPRRVMEGLLSMIDDIFIFDECVCRSICGCSEKPKNIGCMALGPSARRIHPSHGRWASQEEAFAHVDRAARAGLVANVAHTWIDSVAFGLSDFRSLMFICFCDDCCCIFRRHMKSRGPNLDKAYRKLPGIGITVNGELCTGCGSCVDGCFLHAIDLRDGTAYITGDCAGCGRCLDACAQGALALHMDSEDELLDQLVRRIKSLSTIPLNNPR